MATYPRIEINGIAMDDPDQKWAMAPGQQLRGLPGRRATSISIPGRSGVVWPRSDPRDVGSFSVSLTVLGDGGSMDARTLSLATRLDALNFLFDQPSIVVDYFVSAASIYRAECRLVAAVTPTYIGMDSASVTYVLEIPDAVWRAQYPSTYLRDSTDPGGISGGIRITPFDGSTAPITDAVFSILGPCASFTVTDSVTAQQLRVVPPSGLGYLQQLIIDCGAQTAKTVTSSGVATDITGSVQTFGPGSSVSWLNLTPAPVGNDPFTRAIAPAFYFTGFDSRTSWGVTAKRAFS